MAKKAAKQASKSSRRKQSLAISIKDLPKVRNPAVVTAWVDSMQFLGRSDLPIATMRFETALPEAAYEVCRLQSSVDHIKRMIDVMCENVDYYPSKPTPKKSRGRESS